MAEDDETSTQFFWQAIAKPKSPELVVNHKDKKPYTAFETQDKLLAFLVYVPSATMVHTLFYHHLNDIVARIPEYDFICVTTNTTLIKIYGRNLQQLSVALGLHTCKSFSEFHPDWFLDQPDESKPFISKIEAVILRGGSDIRQGMEANKGEGV